MWTRSRLLLACTMMAACVAAVPAPAAPKPTAPKKCCAQQKKAECCSKSKAACCNTDDATKKCPVTGKPKLMCCASKGSPMPPCCQKNCPKP